VRRFYVEVSDTAFGVLGRLARYERRPVRDQAAVVLERALAAAAPRESRDGVPAPDRPDGRGRPARVAGRGQHGAFERGRRQAPHEVVREARDAQPDDREPGPQRRPEAHEPGGGRP
jgi:hypothetical protein